MRKTLLTSAALIIFGFSGVASEAMERSSENESALVAVTGQIIDKQSGEALAGVLVQFEGLQNSIYTDLEGKFEIPVMVPGTYNVSTTLISYQKKEMKLDLNRENADQIKISLDHASLK